MSLKRDITSEADIQSFAVSNGSILVPFVEEVTVATWNNKGNREQGNIDKENNIVMCLPKPQYDILRSRELIDINLTDRSVSNPQSADDQTLANSILKHHIITKYLTAVEIIGSNPYSKDSLKNGQYYVRITSDRQYPYLGEFILGSLSSKLKHITVPKSEGKTSGDQSPLNQFSDDSYSQVQDLRSKFLDSLYNAARASDNLNASLEGPYYKDPEKDVYYSHENMVMMDMTKKIFSIFTNKAQGSKIHYDGLAEVYKNDSRLRQYGDPKAIYKRDNLGENPAQESGHSTFFSPKSRYVSSPMINMDENIPQILQQFAPILGL